MNAYNKKRNIRKYKTRILCDEEGKGERERGGTKMALVAIVRRNYDKFCKKRRKKNDLTKVQARK